MNLELQRQLLSDSLRNRQFHKAIAEVVQPGHVVVDLGAGTGYLGFLALQQGAQNVVFVEADPILEYAVHMAQTLGVMDRCKFLECHSSALPSGLSADVILCETLGTYAFEEGLIENWIDAKPWSHCNTTWIPSRVCQKATYVTDEAFHKTIDIWSSIEGSLPWSELRKTTLSRSYSRAIPKKTCHKSPQELFTVSPQDNGTSQWSSSASWTSPQNTTVYGFCLFWEAQLSPTVALSTSPWGPSTHWKQLYLPLLKPLPVDANNPITLDFSSDTRHDMGMVLRWHATTTTQDQIKHECFMDSTNGFPVLGAS